MSVPRRFSLPRRRLGALLLLSFSLPWAWALGIAPSPLPGATAADNPDPTQRAQGLIEQATDSFQRFLHDPEMATARRYLSGAKGVLLVPEMVRMGVFVGGSGGVGVLLVRDESTGRWSNPAFYSVGGGSIGLQFGVQLSEVLMLAMTQGGVDSLLSSKFRLGADASLAAGPMGSGITGDVQADFITFARTRGVFAGVAMDGAIIQPVAELNRAYYGQPARAVDILVLGNVPPKAPALKAAIAQATAGEVPAVPPPPPLAPPAAENTPP